MTSIRILYFYFYIFTFHLYLTNYLTLALNQDECNNTTSTTNGKVRTAGTGTVLFNPTDIYKTCWSQEEIAILTARLILEDAIPDPKAISIQCNDDVEDLVEYFKGVIDTIRSNTKGRKRHIMLMAFTDLLGGFLHHAVFPMARKAYYAGAVDYSYMEKLIQLFEELKWFLRTNGQGWTKPMVITKEPEVPPINLDKIQEQKDKDNKINTNTSCCHKLLFYEHEPVKTMKRSISTEKGIYFPLPFFDAKYKPTAIVVPLKRYALRNIESKRAAYVMMKYFVSAEKCLKEKNAKPEMVQRFQNNLLTWIEKDVIPKLNDDKFYSAFGGILRVYTSLKFMGAKVGPATCNTDEGEEEVGAVPALGCSSSRNKLILIAMLVIIVAWFLIGTCFICYRIKNSKSSKSDDDKSPKPSSSTSFSSSKWSSILSKSSSKTSKTHKDLCKCCESSISEKSTPGYTSTSEYDSEKTRKKERKRRPLGLPNRKNSKSSPCVCPTDGPAVIDTNHSMKVLPSIAEISENSLSKDRNESFKRISFADESGLSSSDGGTRICAPPWAQTKKTVPCPHLSDKSTNYSSSRSSKSRGVPESNVTVPIASSTQYDTSINNQSSQQNNNEFRGENPSSSSYEDRQETGVDYNTALTNPIDTTNVNEPPLANSTFNYDITETSNDPDEELYQRDSNNKMSTTGTVEEDSYKNEEKEKEPKDKSYYDYHMSACHSSISGNYDLFHRPDPNKPYIFGYDFQTSTSSELSEDEDESKY